ncbi:hypothetical protein MTR67_043561 [Solanum verrucosum]|uniref:Retrotransposon gag domain-containing protein n=1 Tax=Solanum verrucosum TaxID=315347 RepID=A0AAF0ZSS9_SOLVR|nr:hypothetical protein MTR67_043561 [Solanum verrucosum]
MTSGSKSLGNTSGNKTIPTCSKCSKNHPSECLACRERYFGSTKSGHRFKDFPSPKQGYEVSQKVTSADLVDLEMGVRLYGSDSGRDGGVSFLSTQRVAQICYDQWKKARLVRIGPIEWEGFHSAFLDRFFHLEMREPLVLEFINLRQGDMSVKEYAWRFTQLFKYVPHLVSDPRSGMSKCHDPRVPPRHNMAYLTPKGSHTSP